MVESLEHGGRSDTCRSNVFVLAPFRLRRSFKHSRLIVDCLIDPVVPILKVELLWVKFVDLCNDFHFFVVEGSFAISRNHSFFEVRVIKVWSLVVPLRRRYFLCSFNAF